MLQLPMFAPESSWRPPRMEDLPSWEGVKRIGIDTETRDPYLSTLGPSVRRGGYVVGISFSLEDGDSFYLPVRHEGGDNLDEEQVWSYIRYQARHYRGILTGANINYDLDYLGELDIHFPHISHQRDIQVADPLIDELQLSYSMERICGRHGVPGKDETVLRQAAAEYGVNPKADLWKLPARYVGAYAEADAHRPLMVLRRQERIIEEQDLWGIFNLECRVQPVLLKMRRRGVKIDLDKLAHVERWSLEQETQQLAEVHRLTGVRVGVGEVWNADAMAAPLIREGIEIPRTEEGKLSITADWLDAMDHPAGRCLARARKVNKLRTTFAQSLRNHMENGDRIHCTFNQLRRTKDDGDSAGVRYGRLSSEHPNLQQQPSRDDFASMWRSVYIPNNPGQLWMSADYCFSDDTEVLTDRGWRLFKNLDQTERLAQWRPDGVVEFAKPLGYQRVQHTGDMVHVHGERQIDLMVSPNHNCLLLSNKGYPKFVKAGEYRDQYGFQLHSGMYGGSRGEDINLLRCVVAIQADGSDRTNNYRVWLKKRRKIDRLRELLMNARLEFHETLCPNKSAGHDFVIEKCPQLSRYLGENKSFSRSLLELRSEFRDIFLNELELWDGSEEGHYYCSTNRDNVDLVQEMAVLTNRRSNLTHTSLPSGKILYATTLTRRTRTQISSRMVSRTPYNGYIYCVTMPWHTVVVRRDGRVSVTGQSQQEPRQLTHFAELMRLPKAFEAAEKYRNDPTTDNHQMMADLCGLPGKKGRKQAKLIYLGLCYGMGGAKLANDLGLPTKMLTLRNGRKILGAGDEAQALIDKFNHGSPFVKKLAKAAERRAMEVGYIVTVLKRRCRFPRDDAGNFNWCHKALNRLVQGSSADQTKKAMVDVDAAGYYIQLQVHDELDGSMDDMEQCRGVAEIMENCVKLTIPSKIDLEVGPSWGEAKEVK